VNQILKRSAALGFLGGMPVPDQIDHALGFVLAGEAMLGRAPGSVVDLGSGGGVPGVVLASCWPDSRVVLIDANERRTDFLGRELDGTAGRPSLHVVRGRAEELGRTPELRETFDLVTARSFGPPAVTAECGSPLMSDGGVLVVSEPPDVDAAERWPADGLALIGLSIGRGFRFGDRFGYQAFRKTAPVSERYPRRTGIPTKRPLF
jgi:16S rRNA (guanine527-N7)-methyltransferase